MMRKDLKGELKKLSRLQVVKEISQRLNSYEVKVRSLIKSFEERGQDARTKSKKQLDQFIAQVKKTRGKIEKKFKVVVNQETERLNRGLGELTEYFKTLSKSEKPSFVPRRKKTKTLKSPTRSRKKVTRVTRPVSRTESTATESSDSSLSTS